MQRRGALGIAAERRCQTLPGLCQAWPVSQAVMRWRGTERARSATLNATHVARRRGRAIENEILDPVPDRIWRPRRRRAAFPRSGSAAFLRAVARVTVGRRCRVSGQTVVLI
eukprot:84775-Prymnesium_polylepis.1